MKRILPDEISKANGRPFLHRGYRSSLARKIAIAHLRRRGLNYFVCYRDTQSAFALQAGWAAWVGDGQAYICR